MKPLKFAIMTTLIVFTSTSCIESSKKYKALLAERDSIQLNMQVVQESYNQSIDLLSAVDSGFAAISETEKSLKLELNGIEGSSSNSKKQEIAARFDQVKKILDENKSKIGRLQALLTATGSKNAKLMETVKRLEKELSDRTASLTELQDQLAKKDIQIKDLNTTVTKLNTNVSALNEETSKQKNIIKEQDASMNRVFYTVASSKTLREWGIVTRNGLFQAKSVMAGNFNKSAFTAVDKRELNAIPTASRRVKLLTSHPADSYTLDINEDKTITLVIKNVEKFWSVSKYLVVQK